MIQTNNVIKSKAICIFRNENEILVSEYYNNVDKEFYYRPIGGNIEFGESSERALKREIREEIGADVYNIQLLDVVENIYFNKKKPSHEILFVYEADFVEDSYYQKDYIEAHEGSRKFKVIWKKISDFVFGDDVLYPKKIIELLGIKLDSIKDSSKSGSSIVIS